MSVTRLDIAGIGTAAILFGLACSHNVRTQRSSSSAELAVIIQQAVWLYARFILSFCDVEDLAERGIVVWIGNRSWEDA
jgi:hypothetical protein